MKRRNVLMEVVATAAALMMMGCDLIDNVGEDPVERIARDNSETARVLREAFRNGTFDDALASVMEDSLVAEEVFSVVHGHPRLLAEEQLTAIKQMTPTEQLRLLTAPAARRATSGTANKAKSRTSETIVARAPDEAKLDESIRYFLRLERGEIDASSTTPGKPATWSERGTTSSPAATASTPRDTAVDYSRGNQAVGRSDTAPGARAVERRNDRAREP